MLMPLRCWAIAIHCPSAFSGGSLHRAGLAAAAAGEFSLADRLFETAGLRYRADLMVPALARLRVHQLMARAEACFESDHDAALEHSSEIARRLQTLDVIEDPAPPFRLLAARDLIPVWTARCADSSEARAA